MKKPSGMAKATLAAAGQRMSVRLLRGRQRHRHDHPALGAHCRQAPLVMNSGTGARLGASASGSGMRRQQCGRPPRTGTRRRRSTAPPVRDARRPVCTPAAPPMSGISASAYRVGSAPSITGRSAIWL